MFRLRNFHNILEHYIQNGLLLTEEFSNLAGIKLQKDTKNSKRVFTKFMLETDKNCIDVIKRLRERNIYATHLTTENGGLYQQRFDLHPLYNLVTKNCKNYLHLHDRIITLPISHNMNKNEIKYYKEQLDNILNRGEN
jgi:dTDP-4-amino-4,6-dideoxygalactose transaminase